MLDYNALGAVVIYKIYSLKWFINQNVGILRYNVMQTVEMLNGRYEVEARVFELHARNNKFKKLHKY